MVERLRRARRTVGVGMACVVLVAACTGDGEDIEARNGDGDDLVDGEVASEPDDGFETNGGSEGDSGSEDDGDFGEPTPEDTTEEAPAEVEIDSTTIEVATLPIGGDAEDAGENLQCVDVGWSAPPEIPAGVTVVIQGLVLEPPGHFELADQPCPGDAPPCLPDHAVTPEQRCVVALSWTDAAEHGGSLRASGTIVCDADTDVCSAFADAVAAAVAEPGDASIGLLSPPTGTTPPGDGEPEDGSGPAGGSGEHQEDDEPNDAEGSPADGQGDAEENDPEGAPEDGQG